MGYISILLVRRSLKIDIVYIAKNEDDDIDFREGVKKSEKCLDYSKNILIFMT